MSATEISRKKKAVAIWLLIGVFMIMIQVVLGGITRLTDSGLSMTEWDPIMGAIPPLNHQQWMEAFKGYQGISQFKVVNSHYSLSDFKFIFFWEWFHRLWARSLGVVFAIPFIYFLVKKYFSKDMIWPLILLFILGGFQGFIGWYMVQSGLDGSSLLRVSHIRLSIHFISALVLLCYTLWFALKLLIPKGKIVYNVGTRNFFLMLLVLLTIQLFYGAFMAGLRAALSAPTWPKMNGVWIPARMMAHNWINDPINVQFVHRGLAYALFILIFFGFFKTWQAAKAAGSDLLRKAGNWPLILVSIQVVLGVLTVISAPHIIQGRFGIYEVLAQSHQLVAMCLLMALIVVLYLVSGAKKIPAGS